MKPEQFEVIFETAPIGLGVIDCDLRYVTVNPRLAEIHGVPQTDHPGRRLDEVLPADLADPLRQHIERAFETDESVPGQEIAGRLAAHAPEVCWVVNIAPISAPDGSPPRVSLVVSDVTERVRATHALALAQQGSQSGVWTHDLVSHALYWSEQYCELFGLDPDEPASVDAWLEATHSEDGPAVLAELKELLADPEAERWTVEYRLADASRWVSTIGMIERDEKGEPIRMSGIAMDVTDRKRTQHALEEANRHKDEFLAMLGHELRNPLAAIRHVADLLNVSPLEQGRLDRARDVLVRQSRHMTRLLNEMLDVSRIERGKLQLELELVDLSSIVEACVTDREASASKADVELHADLDYDLTVLGDRIRLAQAVDNLISNAISYSSAGGTVEVEVRAAGMDALVAVRDDGAGIAPDFQERIFEPFRQAPQTPDRSTGGLGLGLSLVRGVVELHGGSVEVHSEGLGQGSEFVMQLPREITEASHPELLEPPRDATAGVHFLLVEDNVDAAELLAELLQYAGHTVDIAHTGPAALDYLKSADPDIVLCDIGLPEMDGYEVAQTVRSAPEYGKPLMVALTGYGRARDRQRAHAAGFDAHLTKPVHLDMIGELVDNLVADRQHLETGE